MEALETDRLILRAWGEDDVDFVFDMYSRWDVQRFIGAHPRLMASRQEALALITRWSSPEHPVGGIWAVQKREDSSLLGTMLLKPIPESGEVLPLRPSGDTEIGWHFHPRSWGYGYATEAAGRVLAHAFELGLDRVVAVVNPANGASMRVAARTGMTYHGLTSRYYNQQCELFTATGPEPAPLVGNS